MIPSPSRHFVLPALDPTLPTACAVSIAGRTTLPPLLVLPHHPNRSLPFDLKFDINIQPQLSIFAFAWQEKADERMGGTDSEPEHSPDLTARGCDQG